MMKAKGLEDYRNMTWQSKDSSIRIKYMDSIHICNTIKTITYGKGGSFCNHSSKDWLLAFEKELDYRNKMGDAILKKFPILFRDINKALAPVKHKKHKNKAKKKVFTTKGITLYEYQINRPRTNSTQISKGHSQGFSQRAV